MIQEIRIMDSCPYCGNEVEAGNFICESCSGSSSTATVAVGEDFSLSSVPSSSLSEKIASESVIQIDEAARLSQAEYINSANFESNTVESKFNDSKSDAESSESLKEVAGISDNEEKQPYQVVSSTATKSQAVVTDLKPEIQQSSKTNSSGVGAQTTSSQGLSLPEKTESKEKTQNKSNHYQSPISLEENQPHYTEAQKQYMKETSQNALPQRALNYTSAQREFLSDTRVEERLKTISVKELAKLKIHSDFEILNKGSEQNRALYIFLIITVVIFVFPIMTSGVIGFTFSVILLVVIVSIAKAVINGLILTDWNKYATWVYRKSKPKDYEFNISFVSAYMVDRLTIIDKGKGDNNPLLGKALKVKKHSRDLEAIQKLYNSYVSGRGYAGKLFVLDEEEPLICVVEIDGTRFWCEPTW